MNQKGDGAASQLVASEDLILFAFGAVGAFEAADKQNRYSERHQDSQHARVRCDPMEEVMHMPQQSCPFNS